MDQKTYFENLKELLDLEKKEDAAQYESLAKNNSTAEKRAQGLAWYPIAIRGQEIGRGDYLTVELERTTHHDISHQFRFGAPAVLFSNHDPAVDRVEGTVSFQGGNRIKLTLKTDELPDWARMGKLGLELLFDHHAYEEMFAALKLAKTTENELLEVLIGHKKPGVIPKESYTKSTSLNESQQSAIQKIIDAEHLAIVHGPPGTGKTTTLVAAIQELVNARKEKILVVAPSNTAVDLLAEKLTQQGLNVLRVGNSARVSELNMKLTIDDKMASHPDFQRIKKLKKQASEYKNMAHKYKRSFGKAEREQRKALFDEAHKIMKDVEKLEDYIMADIQSEAQIVAATPVGANHYTVKNMSFHTVIIDEAGQALEPACWIPILKAQKVVLAGDHFQLSPTIKSDEAGRAGLSQTLLEKLAIIHPETLVMLREQYRMHEQIMVYSSRIFYDNKLTAHLSVAHRKLSNTAYALKFIDTAGKGFEEKPEGTSVINPEEADFVLNRLTEILQENAGERPSVAIISPYKKQVNLLADKLKEHTGLKDLISQIDVNTIDSFQGQEREVVVISLTRSNDRSEIGFLADTRRMNVAMTRAQKLLLVIGDSSTLGSNDFYKGFIEYTEQQLCYTSAWEYAD